LATLARWFQHLGARFRAVRIRRGWRQLDVARRVGLNASTISRIERGHLERIPLGTLLGVARARALVVIELKTDIVDVNDLIGQMDRRRRLARRIAKERDWDPLTISTWVIVAAGRTIRARLAAHRALLRNAFPSRRPIDQGLAAAAGRTDRRPLPLGSCR
jgi:transcriptional regulator with XRE-family HTH domain